MPEDSFTTAGSPWSSAPHPADDAATAPTTPRSPGRHAPADPWEAEATKTEDRVRLRRLLWVFAILTAVLITPSLVSRIEYARTSARERARLDVARENLKDFKLDQISTAYRMLAQSVGPSVVNIQTRRGRREGQGEGIIQGQGSGVIVDASEGFIVTNNHVVDGVGSAEIQLSDGRSGTASVVGVDPLTDIAVLKTELRDLVAAEWGDSDELQVGDLVWALGSPFGLQKSITSGILSAKERRGITGSRVIQEFLQSDAAVNPGNSGGPLVNHEGKIVGINTAIIGREFQGISFAVPSELARASYEQLRDNGYVLRGFLGVEPDQVPEEVVRDLELERGEGVFVAKVEANSPAWEADLQRGDVILKWNNEDFSDPTLLSRAIAATPIGSEIPITIVRDTARGKRQLDKKVTVAARPKQF